MAFVPFASWNSRSITHLANYLSRSSPMNSSDESILEGRRGHGGEGHRQESAAILATVRKGTAWLPSRYHDRCMRHKKRKKERDATRASVKKEMAKPRMSKSARIREPILDTTRIPRQPNTTMP